MNRALTVCCIALCACASAPRDEDVAVHGALRAMFHAGDTAQKVALASLLPDPEVYAVGALTDLAGEVTVLDGTAYLSYPAGPALARTEAVAETDAGATLLVAARVRAWQRVTVEREIRFADLDDEVARLAAASGFAADERVPFRVEGEVEDLRWHVIDGSRLDGAGGSHEDHLNAAVQLQRARSTARLVGFYSTRDQGVFTHIGARTHVHCVVDAPLSAGHVDHVVIPAGATIAFPAR